MARAYVGTSGFSYPEWRGIFYPEKMASDEFLGFYAGRLNGVEIDRTFYRMPNRATLENWKAATPPGFKFALKASQKITHFERLKLPSEPLDYLLGVLPLLDDRLGVLLYQLPPSLKLNLERLETFLANCRPAEIPAAFEFRHESWFVDPVYRLLEKHRAALCICDDEDATSPIELTAPFTYVRLRRDEYAPEARALWRSRFAEWTQSGVDVFAFIKHEEQPDSPVLAQSFAEGLNAA